MHQSPKKIRNRLRLGDKTYGAGRRMQYAQEILDKAPTIPKPLQFDDIDKAFTEFVKENIELVIEGEKVPTFVLFSNQRFSEYSQTWKHTDANGNLLLNFKTITRNNEVIKGTSLGSSYNIPGDYWIEVDRRIVLDDNGEEHFEVVSMKQPFTVDFTYKIGFVTDKFNELNNFNMTIQDLFKSKQCYIRPNGHYIPMTLESISDESKHNIEERKFYSQVATIKVLAYIIREGDIKVDDVPMRKNVFIGEMGLKERRHNNIEIEEVENEGYNEVNLSVKIDFDAMCSKMEFDIDSDMIIDEVKTINVRQTRINVNDTPYFIDNGFSVKDGDNIKIRVKKLNDTKPAKVVLIGRVPNSFYKVSDEESGVVYTEDESSKEIIVK